MGTRFFVNDTIAVLARDGLLRLIGPDGQVYLNEKVDSWSWANPDNFHRTLLIKIQKGENIGVLDERGHVVVPLQYRNLRWFVDGLLCLEDAARQQVIFNRQGREVVPKQTAEMYYAGRGLFMVVKNRELGKSGMVDSTGQTVLPFEYAECRIIQEDNAFTYSPFLMTRRLKQRLYAMHALDGRPLTEALYTDARWSSFAPGLLFVQLPDNTWQMLGDNGQLLHEDAFDQLDRSGRAVIGSKNNVGHAFFRLDGTRVTDFLYSSARGLTNDYQATEFARRLGLDSYLKLLGEASRTGKPQVFIDIEGRELILPKEK
ncbi:MAG: WG repeat-containing protein [Lewinellaceae bacterium]|nr:WG repeat-containing protein [Lewinellaceae bacterium]